MDQNQALLLSAIVASAALLFNTIIRGLSTYIQAVAVAKAESARVIEAAKAKKASIDIDDTEQRFKLDAREREFILRTINQYAEDLRQ